MLGFETSFNSSYCCRICRVGKLEMHKLLAENTNVLRTVHNYSEDVDEVAHGVIEECVFNALPYFHVCDNISIDPMHDLFEGICRYELGEILYNLIVKMKFFFCKHIE